MMSAAVRSVVLGALRRGVPAWVLSGAALDFDFVNGRGFNSIDRAKLTPDSILTYTNPSAKLVYGNDGVLRYAPHNLLTYSEQFDNAAWTALGGGYVVTANATATAAPNGTMTADKLASDVTTSAHNLGAGNDPVAAVHTFSIYAKAAELSTLQLFVSGASMGFVNFDLSSGTVGTSSLWSGSIQNVGSGWYRCIAVTNVLTATNSTWRVLLTNSSSASRSQNFTGDGTSGIYIWGAQLNLGSSALTYVPTTTAAVYSLPIDHNPTTFAPLGVLIEEQRTNLLTYSEQFDNAAWAKGGSVTVTTNAVTAPDGTTTADKVVETASTSTHNISQTSTIVTATVYTQSVYAKAAERSWVCLEGGGGAGSYSVWFNLSTGTVGTINNTAAGNVSIVALPNGWYRCIVTDTSTSTSGTYRHYICDADNNQSYTGDGTSGLYLWGAQLEAGAFATSYIPTVASQVTRTADNVSILTSAFAYNAAAGTFVVDANVRELSSGASGYFAACAGAGGNSDTHNLYRTSGSEQLQIRSGASTVALISPAGGSGSAKMAYAYAVDDYAISKNGGAVGSDPLGALPVGVDRVQIGTVAGANYANGPIKRLTYFPTRRTNADLQVLST